MLLDMPEFPSFLRLKHICSSIHLLMDIWVASTWLLWIMLLWTWICDYLFNILCSILLNIYPEMELLDHKIILFLIFWGRFIPLSIAHAAFYHLTNSSQAFQCFCILIDTHYFFLYLILLILMGMKWCLTVVLLCISLVIGNFEHVFISLLDLLHIVFEEMSIEVLCPFLNWVIWVFVVKL